MSDLVDIFEAAYKSAGLPLSAEPYTFKNGRILSIDLSRGSSHLNLDDPHTNTRAHFGQYVDQEGIWRTNVRTGYGLIDGMAAHYSHEVDFEGQRSIFSDMPPNFLTMAIHDYARSIPGWRFNKNWRHTDDNENWLGHGRLQSAKLLEQFTLAAIQLMTKGELPDFSVLNDHFGSDFIPGEKLLETSFEPDGTPAMVIDA